MGIRRGLSCVEGSSAAGKMNEILTLLFQSEVSGDSNSAANGGKKEGE